MKLGLVVHFFDFRNDVRQWIEELSKEQEVVLFLRKEDEETIRKMAPDHLEIRIIEEKKSSIWNKFWEVAFRFFGKLPKSRQNYYLMEQFKISISDDKQKVKSATRMLNFSMSLPKVLGYDDFISQLVYKKKTRIEDIDHFVCFTELSDNYLISRLIDEKKKIFVYVYSWDHPCKHLRFSKRLQYLVWHNGIKEDVANLQEIPEANIRIIGATQMGYVHRFLEKKDQSISPYPFDYVYFGCAIGVPPLVPLELEIVRKTAESLKKICPDWKLVVRPYPVLRDWSHYDALKEIDNIVVDDGFRNPNSVGISVGEEAILQKFITIQNSKAFLHLGTTLGVEASYTDSPSILLDLVEYSFPEKNLSLHHFIHQFQNDKYLNLKGFQNVVKSENELNLLFETLKKRPGDLLPYNQKVRENLPTQSFSEMARKFSEVLLS